MSSMFSDGQVPFHSLPWAKRYKIVLASKRWKDLRLRIISERKQCQRCGSTSDLELHHLTYERLGIEQDTDLELVCKPCHEAADAERAKKGSQKSRKALNNARLNGWASKKYGENWQDTHDPERVAEEFDEWRERNS